MTKIGGVLGAVTLAICTGLSVSALADPTLVVPGRSIGRTQLGPNGDYYLRKLPTPDDAEAGMSQRQLTWTRRRPGGKTYTLFIHTTANGALDVLPLDGVTIDEIRVTSPVYHTTSGIHVGSTLAQILRAFPKARASESSAALYDDTAHRISFQFRGRPVGASPCTAIEVYEKP